ncbi:ER membrane protein complex subunit 8/9, partial [Intoshia linei]
MYLSKKAIMKMCFHSAKYPHYAINGLLLASSFNGPNKDSICEAYPLFHEILGLSGPMEIATLIIQEYIADKNLKIVGYYQANEHISNSTPNESAYSIAESFCDDDREDPFYLVM